MIVCWTDNIVGSNRVTVQVMNSQPVTLLI